MALQIVQMAAKHCSRCSIGNLAILLKKKARIGLMFSTITPTATPVNMSKWYTHAQKILD